MADLKDRANPNFGLLSELTKSNIEQNDLLKEQNDTLAAQLEADKEHYSDWKDSKAHETKARIFDTNLALLVAGIVAIGIYLDMLAVNPNSAVVDWLFNYFN